MGPINVVVQDANNLVLEVTPTPNNTVILDRGIAGPTGIPGINWLGPWNSATTYAIRDAVSYNGSSYYAIAVNTNQVPPNPSFWDLLAQKGMDGTGVGTVTSVGGTGTVNGITLSGTVTSSGSLTLGGALSGVSLTTQVAGTLPVANGGTGATTLATNNVILGNGTSAVQVVAPGTTGNVLTSNGTTWQSTPPVTPPAQVYPGAGMAVSTGTAWGTSKATPIGDVVGTTDAQTLTNKRITPRSIDIASAATVTPTGDTADQYEVTALAVAATIAAPTGTPTDGQKLVLRFKDNGTARALTWTTTSGAYRAVGVTLPTTTVISKVLYVGCIWNAQDSFWDVVAVAQLA